MRAIKTTTSAQRLPWCDFVVNLKCVIITSQHKFRFNFRCSSKPPENEEFLCILTVNIYTAEYLQTTQGDTFTRQLYMFDQQISLQTTATTGCRCWTQTVIKSLCKLSVTGDAWINYLQLLSCFKASMIRTSFQCHFYRTVRSLDWWCCIFFSFFNFFEFQNSIFPRTR